MNLLEELNKIISNNNSKLNENMKGIVTEKKKIEKNYREEIINLLKKIKQKEKKLESLNKEIKEISELYEKKKNIFYDNDDIAKVIKREAENLDIKQDFQKKTLMKGKIKEEIEQKMSIKKMKKKKKIK